jgi:hypothetical protein
MSHDFMMIMIMNRLGSDRVKRFLGDDVLPFNVKIDRRHYLESDGIPRNKHSSSWAQI